MERGDVETVREYYKLLELLRKIRKNSVKKILDGKEVDGKTIEKLQKILVKIKSTPENDSGYLLFAGQDERIVLQLNYEIESLRKDLIYLKQGERGLKEYLRRENHQFDTEINEVYNYLKGKRFDSFVANRDGALNEISERYSSSIQTIYNALFFGEILDKFQNKIILTESPLRKLKEVNLFRKNDAILAGSNGRNFEYKGKNKKFYVPYSERKKLGSLKKLLKKILEKDEYKKLSYIGCGFEENLGGIKLSRQDISGSVDKKLSNNFRNEVDDALKKVDPKGEYFKVEDDGFKIYIELKWGNRIFDRGSGLGFIKNSLKLNFSKSLVCGSSEEDLDMLKKLKKISEETSVIFVTKDETLKEEVKSIVSDAVFVSDPDNLVFALKEFFKKLRVPN